MSFCVQNSAREADGFSAWVKDSFEITESSIGTREALISQHTERVILSLFEVQGVQVERVVVSVSLSEQSADRRRCRVYTIGLDVKGRCLMLVDCDGNITVKPRLRLVLKDFDYVRDESGRVLSGGLAPVDALFGDDRSVTSVEQYVKSSVDGWVFSRSIADCVPLHSYMKSGQVKSGDSGMERVAGSGRKRRMEEDEEVRPKRRRVELPVSLTASLLKDFVLSASRSGSPPLEPEIVWVVGGWSTLQGYDGGSEFAISE